MAVSVLLFGIARDLIGQSSLNVPARQDMQVTDLLQEIHQQYPAVKGIRSLLVAVNGEYAESDQVIKETDEVALIPPVSGG
ncbi:MoaD/ThiS family protein [Spirosoma sp. KUDC1026]|uniref:MoaD/ThiS family protein n=1 Tax=Spirosoma sp. KUDC1026 TaxID=2745947 RepID=UPI00159BBDA1|nr:MoaD/ThiS family protein [Spirosoma sp. KUDC1026]QKZ12369.1 MoaD/ThiS family protein [Spirosoma sp. KUDC1026]